MGILASGRMDASLQLEWSVVDINTPNAKSVVLAQNNNFYIANGNGLVTRYRPSDGTTAVYTVSNRPFDTGIRFGSRQILMSGAGNSARTDNEWSSFTTFVPSQIATNMTTDGSLIVCSTNNGSWLVSSNGGDSFLSYPAGDVTGTINNIGYGALGFIFFANNVYYTSPNGYTWTYRRSISGLGLVYSVAFGNGVYVAVGTGGIFTSNASGIFTNVNTNTFYHVKFIDGLFIAVGGNWRIWVSIDGIEWIEQTTFVGTKPTADARYLDVAGNKIMVVGNAGPVTMADFPQL